MDLNAPPETGVGISSFPVAYGPYLLLHRIARGGVGNVYLAKTGGIAGIAKHCVVKTLRAQVRDDPESLERFMAEARIVVQLAHRNICPVFDVGRVGDSYYLAMELVVGRDLRSLQRALAAAGRSLSEACALHVVCEMLDALDCAHRHVDQTTGEPLGLVHRDVSPQNVMVSHEGDVKLIDFGLAETRSASKDAAAASGTVWGKIAYMAPEQARGDAVDARGDQFAAAIVAFELLAGDRYYGDLGRDQIWASAGVAAHRPPALATFDPALRAVLERALAPKAADRFASCGDFRDALLAYARGRGLHAGARELRIIMGELFRSDVDELRQILQSVAPIAAKPMPAHAMPGTAEAFASIATSSHAERVHDPTTAVIRFVDGSTTAGEPLPTRSPLAPFVLAGAAVVAVAVVAIVAMRASATATTASTASAIDAGVVSPVVAAQDAPPVPTPPAVVDADVDKDPEPLSPTTTKHEAHHATPAKAKPAAPALPEWRVELDYLKQSCRALPCAKQALDDFKSDMKKFKAEAGDCVAQCKRSR